MTQRSGMRRPGLGSLSLPAILLALLLESVVWILIETSRHRINKERYLKNRQSRVWLPDDDVCFQVKIACDLRKPLFIHEREACDDLCQIMDKFEDRLPPAVIHCFTGTAGEAIKYIDKGFNIGLTGYLWKDRSENGVRYALKEKMIPLDRLLLETDAPYMFCKVDDKKLPAEVRGKISEEASFGY